MGTLFLASCTRSAFSVAVRSEDAGTLAWVEIRMDKRQVSSHGEMKAQLHPYLMEESL